jgi:hypothetical protein
MSELSSLIYVLYMSCVQDGAGAKKSIYTSKMLQLAWPYNQHFIGSLLLPFSRLHTDFKGKKFVSH